MRSLKLALRALRREWRSGELAVLWLSLSIAVAALSGVGFLVDRIGRAVQLQASEVLAADRNLRLVYRAAIAMGLERQPGCLPRAAGSSPGVSWKCLREHGGCRQLRLVAACDYRRRLA